MDDASARYQGVDKSSCAYKLLASMGWQEGQGLGAQKQGIASHVRVKRKADASGVGAHQEAAKSKDWTLGMAAYDRVLATLKTVAAGSVPAKKKQKATKKAAKAPVAEIRPEEAGNELPPKRAKISQIGMGTSRGRPENAETNAIRDKKLVTHVARFQKVAKNKHVKGYSATDLAAILGASNEGQEGIYPQSSAMPFSQSETSLAEARRGTVSDGSDVAENSTVWWRGHFVKAGSAGSGYSSFSSASKRDVRVAGFSESDQANLWQNVTDAQSKSKQGLGQGSSFKVSAKERWQGKKTRIDDSDEDESEAFEPVQEAEVEIGDQEAVILPSKRSLARLLETASESGDEQKVKRDAAGAEGKPRRRLKWRKIARAILESADGQALPIKTFTARAWDVAKVKGARRRKEAVSEVMGLVSRSKQFRVDDKAVALALLKQSGGV